jgi:hypothetical protein
LNCVVIMSAMTSIIMIMAIMESAAELRLLTRSSSAAAASDQLHLRDDNHRPYSYSVLIISYHKTGVSSYMHFLHVCLSLCAVMD